LFIRVFVFGKQKDYPELDMGRRCFWLIGYVILFISYLNFCYNFPHQCTMNFRYMVPTVLYPALAAGLAMRLRQELEETAGTKAKWCACLHCLTVVYTIISILTTIVWCIAV
ncbi:MAG: hypothetical protein PUC23_05375, partial [bacterium]|nr:hypothetical protein [bacterium]